MKKAIAGITVKGHWVEASRDEIEKLAQTMKPENVRVYWVEVGGKRFPPKQLFDRLLEARGLPLGLLDFNSVQAVEFFRKLGLAVGRADQGPEPCVRATIAGRVLDACQSDVERAVRGIEPEPVRKHWVEIKGVKYPPKQVVELVAKQQRVPLARIDFQTKSARDFLRRLGFEVSR